MRGGGVSQDLEWLVVEFDGAGTVAAYGIHRD
jgi:hypothetical protein